MAIKNYNIPPYYDDFDQTKNYLRVLFRPGYAVQARELTQLQTAIQAQIDRFGNHVFKEGSPVLGGQATLDTKYAYVKLQSTFTDGGTTYYPEGDGGSNLPYYTSAVGLTLTGVTSGVIATVLEVVASTTSDSLTAFVRYTAAGTSTTTHQFTAEEILTFTVNGSTKKFKVRATVDNPVGYGTRVSVNEGVYFVKGNFVYTAADSIIVSKYTQNPSARIVYKVSENIVTSTEDASLVDNSIGTPNESAPGAHRYQVSMDLAVEPFLLSARTEDNIIQILLINGGQVTGRARTEYSELARTLATRTYEESGNYTVRPFQINVREYYNNGTNNGLYTQAEISSATGLGTNDAISYGKARLAVGLEPSVAYVSGYRVETLSTTYVPVEKARDEGYINGSSIFMPLGGYIYVDQVVGLPNTTSFSTIELKKSAVNVTFQDSGDTVTLASHGLSNGTKVSFWSITSTTGISTYTTYYVVNTATNTFQLSLTSGGAALPLSTDGSGSMLVSIGTARARALQYDSGTVGSAAFYKLYLFDIVMNSGQSIANVAMLEDTSVPGYDFTARANDVDPAILTTVLYDPSNSSLVYRLPVNAVQSLRASDDVTCDVFYYVKRKFDNVQASGSGQLVLTASSESFYSVTATDYTVVKATDGTQVTQTAVPVLNGGGTSVTLSLGVGNANAYFYVIASTRRNLIEKSKTYVTGAQAAIATPNTTAGGYDSLGKSDILRITAIYMSPALGTAATTSHTLVTDRYNLDDGQRENFYDVGRIQLKPGASAPTGQLLVVFDHFTHNTGDYFAVNSYAGIDYGDIPSFNSIKGSIALRDAMDFRPTKSNDGTGFANAGASTSNCVVPNSVTLTDIQFYLPRMDKIFVNKNGEFGSVKGISGTIPKAPEDPEDSMVLYSLNLNAYTFGTTDLSAKMIDNKRYTMRDIGRMEKRLSNVEYYTSLSLLEKTAANAQIFDSSNNLRYKNGFIVDSFVDHNIGAVKNPDYRCSIEPERGILLPEFAQQYVNLIPNIPASSNIKQTGSLVTLDYREVTLIEQPYSSYSEYVNPHAVYGWQGRMELSPPSDEWKEVETKPAIVANAAQNIASWYNEASANTANNGIWNNWQIEWYGVSPEEEAELNNQVYDSGVLSGTSNMNVSAVAADGSQTFGGMAYYRPSTGAYSNSQSTQVADTIVNNTIVPYIRSRKIYFRATGLKPNSRVYAFFDGVNIANYVNAPMSGGVHTTTFNNYTTNPDDRNYADLTSHPSGATANLQTDAAGQIIGSFIIPHNSALKFRTGERIFRIVDNSLNSTDSSFTSAEAIYRATGIFVPAPTPATQPPVVIPTPRPGPAPVVPPFVGLSVQGRTPKYSGIPFNFTVSTTANGFGTLGALGVKEQSNSSDPNFGYWVPLTPNYLPGEGQLAGSLSATGTFRISPALPGTYRVRGEAVWNGVTYYSNIVTFTVAEPPPNLSSLPESERYN